MTGSLLDRPPAIRPVGEERDTRPVMLLTLNVPFDAASVDVAVSAAAETGAELIVCEALPIGYTNHVAFMAQRFAEQDNRRYLAAAVTEARERGVRTQLVAFHNPKPIAAALEICRERGVGLLVFGADRARLSRWTYRRAVKRLRDDGDCLIWVSED